MVVTPQTHNLQFRNFCRSGGYDRDRGRGDGYGAGQGDRYEGGGVGYGGGRGYGRGRGRMGNSGRLRSGASNQNQA